MQTYKKTCPKCNRKLTTVYSLKLHMNSHSDISQYRGYKCKSCPKSYTNQILLNQHIAADHPEGTTLPFVCEICKKVYPSAFHLKHHSFYHKCKRNYVCETCGARFNAPSRLKAHQISHTGDKAFSCEQCEARFARKNSLTRHMLKHMGIEKYEWQCSKCGKTFYRKESLTAHEEHVHTDIRSFCCEVCGHSFKTSRELKRHKDTHRVELNHECKICFKKFRIKDNLSKHMKVHEPPEIKREINRKRYLEQKRRNQKKSGENGAKELNMDENVMVNVKMKTQGYNGIEKELETDSNQSMDAKLEENENGKAQGYDSFEKESKISLNQIVNNEEDNTSKPGVVVSDEKLDYKDYPNLMKKELTKEGINLKASKKHVEKVELSELVGCKYIANNMSTPFNDYNDMNDTNVGENEQSTINQIDWTCMFNDYQDGKPPAVMYDGKRRADCELMFQLFKIEDKNNHTEHGNLNKPMQSMSDTTKNRAFKQNSNRKEDNRERDEDVTVFVKDDPPVIIVNEEKQKTKENAATFTPMRKFKELVIVEKAEDNEWARHENKGKHTLLNEREIYQCKLCSMRFKLYDTIIMHLEHFHEIADEES